MTPTSSIEITGSPAGWTRRAANAVLTGSAAFWLLVALLGQWAFFYYIAVFYGPSSLSGNFQAWTRNTHLIKGYVPGDTAGNLAFAVHALMAGYIAFGGGLQLVPLVRRYAPVLHRWNGRVFMATALGLSLTGFYMIWVRGATFNLLAATATSLNGALIVLFVVLAWRSARARDFAAHRRHALRLFLVANGQWFIRIGFIGWMIVTQGHMKIAPFFRVWQFACYLLPLAILEIYLRVKDSGSPRARYVFAGALALLTLLMGASTAGAYMVIWRPYL